MSCPEGTHWQRFLSQPDSDSAAFRFGFAHAGKCVLVTGAAGSIGSVLVKALATAGVRRLVLLDSSERSLFELHSRMQSEADPVPYEPLLGSVDDQGLMNMIMSRFRPDLVYHAAAWKHVPLLESNPVAAIRNNVLGTYALAQSALRGGARNVTLISTDKAVNPRSVLGVSKRIAELIVVSLSRRACQMNAIRLCNVIGSSGSVVPVFQNQISENKPVTVTDPDARRRFMSPRQAVQAILACGALRVGGKILLPEAGEPIRIADLAAFLIRSTGSSGGLKSRMVFTAPRPGDKLDEEMAFASERIDRKVAGPLTVLKTVNLTMPEIERIIGELASCVSNYDLPGLVKALTAAVPEYVPSAHLLQAARFQAIA